MTDFLETLEGPDWLHDAINSLICGDNVTAPRSRGKSFALVAPLSLWEALAQHLGTQEHIAPLLTNNREYTIERMICEVIADGRRMHGRAYDLAIEAWGKPKYENSPTALHEVVESLIRPHANEYGRACAEELEASRAADLTEQRKADAA